MKQILLTLMATALISSCCGETIAEYTNVIPQPESVRIYDGTLQVGGASFRIDASLGKAAQDAVLSFENALEASSGSKRSTSGTKIIFKKSADLALEEYTITVCGKKAVIKAAGLNGVLYAIETLKQMLPVEIYTGAQASEAQWTLPYMKIQDKPRFGYRGMHLDVARHFFDVNEVKKYIDIMAIHKLNRFH